MSEAAQPPTPEPTTQLPTPEPQAPPAPQQDPSEDEKRFTQAEMDRAIQTRLERERKVAEEKKAEEKRLADQTRLKEQAEWEKLAAQHESRVKEIEPELETVKGRYTALSERLSKQIDAGMKDWPANAKRMVPDTEDIAARLDAYENMKALLENGNVAPRAPGNATGPRPTGPNSGPDTEAQLRREGRYQAI